MGFARNKDGEIKAMQAIYLDSIKYDKANIDVNKRSYGIISGSYVEVGNFSFGNMNEENQDKKKIITKFDADIDNKLSKDEIIKIAGFEVSNKIDRDLELFDSSLNSGVNNEVHPIW